MTIKELQNKLDEINQMSVETKRGYLWKTSSYKLILVWESNDDLDILGDFDFKTGESNVHFSSNTTAMELIANFLDYCCNSQEYKEGAKAK